LADIKTLFDTPGITGETVSPITVKVVQIAYYLFPNLSFFDIKTQIAHGLSVPLSTVLWTVLYCAVYTTLVVGLASLIFRRREFP
jgi:ABC-type transport system involved in multi-copper enzyme maturation permease subunit